MSVHRMRIQEQTLPCAIFYIFQQLFFFNFSTGAFAVSLGQAHHQQI